MTFGLEEPNFINQLYEGKAKCVVKCLECNNLSERNDKFLDLTLSIRNDFEKIYNNVEKCNDLFKLGKEL